MRERGEALESFRGTVAVTTLPVDVDQERFGLGGAAPVVGGEQRVARGNDLFRPSRFGEPERSAECQLEPATLRVFLPEEIQRLLVELPGPVERVEGESRSPASMSAAMYRMTYRLAYSSYRPAARA